MTDERVVSTERAYDNVAADFAERSAARSEGAASFFDRFCDSLPGCSTVVDLGCGPGHDVRRLVERGHNAIGIDRSIQLLHLGPVELVRIRGDLRNVPLAHETVDAVWCSAALLHVERKDLAKTFAEWDRIVKPGGVIGFATSLGSHAVGADTGWEVVPAGPERIPELADGERRWFVHHDQAELVGQIRAVDWMVECTAVRSSHRDWLQVLALKPGRK